MPEFVDWKTTADPLALVGQAVEALQSGELVAFPTETGYAVVALARDAKAAGKIPAAEAQWSLVLPDPADVNDWVTNLGPVAARLARRCWPGPARLMLCGTCNSERIAQLSVPARERVLQSTSSQLSSSGGERSALVVRIPCHESFLEALFELAEPLLLAEGAVDSGPVWVHSLGDQLTLVIEYDSPRFSQPPTTVQIGGNRWSVECEGVYTRADLERFAACFIYFICTGNTCRSPMAAAICKKLLSDRLGCAEDELPARGFLILSGGVSAFRGEPAPPEAQNVVQAMGADLSSHESRPVSPDLLAQADYIFTMTQGHMQMLTESYPDLKLSPQLLCGDADLEDPLGGDENVYSECAQTIRHHVQRLLAEVCPS
jgi:protein-tyrosine phosphatase